MYDLTFIQVAVVILVGALVSIIVLLAYCMCKAAGDADDINEKLIDQLRGK